MRPQQLIRLLKKEENPPPTHIVCNSSDYEALLTEQIPSHVRLTCSDLVQPGAVFLLRERPATYSTGHQ